MMSEAQKKAEEAKRLAREAAEEAERAEEEAVRSQEANNAFRNMIIAQKARKDKQAALTLGVNGADPWKLPEPENSTERYMARLIDAVERGAGIDRQAEAEQQRNAYLGHLDALIALEGSTDYYSPEQLDTLGYQKQQAEPTTFPDGNEPPALNSPELTAKVEALMAIRNELEGPDTFGNAETSEQ
ncbi:hypothetical protein [Nocardia sp. NPDC020380]|uniref:hypothetical protein n=1 Tax=Nocardia sp. NPDC020380 TaxID=3364309 RepID=UPI0037B8A1FE